MISLKRYMSKRPKNNREIISYHMESSHPKKGLSFDPRYVVQTKSCINLMKQGLNANFSQAIRTVIG